MLHCCVGLNLFSVSSALPREKPNSIAASRCQTRFSVHVRTRVVLFSTIFTSFSRAIPECLVLKAGIPHIRDWLARELQSCCMHSTVLNLDSKMKSCIRASSVDVSPLLLYLFQHHANHHGLFSNAYTYIKGIWLQCHFSPKPHFLCALHCMGLICMQF